jgi:hypothetical protein
MYSSNINFLLNSKSKETHMGHLANLVSYLNLLPGAMIWTKLNLQEPWRLKIFFLSGYKKSFACWTLIPFCEPILFLEAKILTYTWICIIPESWNVIWNFLNYILIKVMAYAKFMLQKHRQAKENKMAHNVTFMLIFGHKMKQLDFYWFLH